MEAEMSTATLPQSLANEFFFKEESRRLQQACGKFISNEDDLGYLLRQLQKLKTLSTSIEQPWDRYIPLLFRSFTRYLRCPDENTSRRKTDQQLALLMDCVTYLSQNGNLIHMLSTFLNNQIEELNNLIDRENPAATGKEETTL